MCVCVCVYMYTHTYMYTYIHTHGVSGFIHRRLWPVVRVVESLLCARQSSGCFHGMCLIHFIYAVSLGTFLYVFWAQVV